MGDGVYATLRAMLFVFAIYSVATIGWRLAGDALSVGIWWKTLLHAFELSVWVHLAFENAPPWFDNRERVPTVAMDDSL